MDRSHLPDSAGCYLMKDINGRVIYVGKAKNIKKRANSYFSKDAQGKTALLVSDIANIDFIATQNEKEALLLENNLIKRYEPRYNIALRDSKRYSYIKLTKEPLPKMIIARRITDDATYIGPFPSGNDREEAMRLARRLFGIKQAKKELKKKLKLADVKNALFDFRTEDDYRKNVELAKLFLLKKTDELILQLESEMKHFASIKNFEAAKSLRDKLFAVQKLSEKQTVELKKRYDKDIIATASNQKETLAMVFHMKKGILSEKDEYRFKQAEFDDEDISDFLMQYYEGHDIPSEIIIEKEFESLDTLEAILSEKAQRKVELIVPSRGDNFELLSLVRKNASLRLDKANEALMEIQKMLRMKSVPKIIECFDVSNTSGTLPTGSLVQFLDGKPNKNEYRRFKIRLAEGPNDFAMIKEIVYRRYYRQKSEGNHLPDLIIVDGGKGQLKFAKEAMKELDLSALPIVGLAKKEETIIFPGRFGLKLDLKNKGSKLIQQIRNEAHRFAVSYHRLLRGKKMLEENTIKETL